MPSEKKWADIPETSENISDISEDEINENDIYEEEFFDDDFYEDDYCEDCGSTDIGHTDIFDWEEKYKEKYNINF